jgi:type II secretory pathway predicted ATPase ExeA
MEWHKQCKDLGIKTGFFDPNSEEELFKSKDLIEAVHKIRETLENNSTLFIQGVAGIGKTTIHHYAKRLFKDEQTEIIESFHLGKVDRASHLYTSIPLSLTNDEYLTKKLADRKDQAINEIKNSSANKFLYLIDNAELIEKSALTELLKFQSENNLNLSIILFGPTLNFDTNELEFFRLEGLRKNEKRKYFQLLNEKTKEKMPYSIPIEEVINSNTYFDIIEAYVGYAWKVDQGIIKF